MGKKKTNDETKPMTEEELKKLQKEVREMGAKLDANPAYQKFVKKLKERVDRNHEQLEYRKDEIMNGRIPDLDKHEDEE